VMNVNMQHSFGRVSVSPRVSVSSSSALYTERLRARRNLLSLQRDGCFLVRRVQPMKASRCCCSRSSSMDSGIDASAGVESIQEKTQANYQQYDVTIRKPMGVVLEEVANGTQKNIASVYVAEVVPGSNAEKMGVREGDLLVSCSAVTLKAGKEGAYAKQGHGGRPFDNFQKGVFVSANQTFDITMAAIASNNERWGFNTVDCTFARACATSSEDL